MAAFNDQRMESLMGILLRFGVVCASTVVLAGGVFYLQDHAREFVHYENFTAHPVNLRHPAEWSAGISRGDAGAIVTLGILLLIATPIARVAFAVVGFALERDRLYVGISIAVLAVLLFGLMHGG